MPSPEPSLGHWIQPPNLNAQMWPCCGQSLLKMDWDALSRQLSPLGNHSCLRGGTWSPVKNTNSLWTVFQGVEEWRLPWGVCVCGAEPAEGTVSFCTHKHFKIMVVAFSFTHAVPPEPTGHEKGELSLSAYPEPVRLCRHWGTLRGITG